MSSGHSRVEAALEALLDSDPTLEISKTRRLGPDWNMREALLVRDHQDHLSLVVERPEHAPRIEPHLGDTMPITWIAASTDSPLERMMIGCPDRGLRTTFLSLIGEVLDRVDATHNSVYIEVSKVVEDWRRVLETVRTSTSRTILIGLFGELTILRDLVTQRGSGAIDFWRGPDGHRHDFFGTNAIEVKTYRGTGSPRVSIHGAHQLDPPVGNELHLISLRVEESAEGETLADIIHDLALAGVNYSSLSGRTDGEEPLVLDARLRLVVMDRRIHAVDETFPGIRASRLDEKSLKGVDRLSYQLLLDACPEPLDASAYVRILGDL
ncbi:MULTISPECIES: PD-(D/E)XK motif protein [unclassified Microbacterium]|uniref:PD-(D/E)XK motif protein n=1 Tax=unclassified Microbacterium TaxID=2609290 RepID=UPI0012F785A7|nr:PD-(D/E)XK motif protein [Microbacterium sp. MAH-37]MVQ41440.1 PD-(D/E)XK motif protein [Microbacterium sp. MAH-37]